VLPIAPMCSSVTLNHRELIMLNIRLIKVAGVTDAQSSYGCDAAFYLPILP
jgi:hypothetical protein